MSKTIEAIRQIQLNDYRNGDKTISLGKMPTTDWGKLVAHMRGER